MSKNFYLSLMALLCFGFTLQAQQSADDPRYYRATPPTVQPGLPSSQGPLHTGIFENIDTTISTVLCDSGTVSLVGTGVLYSGWSTDSLGANVITATDTFNSGTLSSDTTFYHTSVTDTLLGNPGLAGQTGTFSGSVRGYSFVAPVDFVITGFWVPTDAGTGVQHVEILRFGTAPPVFSAVTNDFVSLGSWRNFSAIDTIPANIQIFAGDTIGIYGNRADLNSYGPNNNITIAGISTPITRSGMQFPISTNNMQDVWTEPSSSNISRVEYFYASNPDTFTTQYNITVGQSSATSQTLTACNGDTITFAGTSYTSDTALVSTLTNFLGCDSVITTNLVFAPAITGSFVSTLCDGDSVVVNGTVYNAGNTSGTEVLTAANGCDSTVAVSVTVLAPITGSFTDTLCGPDSIIINGTVYNAQNRTGTEVFTAANGCDSSVAVNVDIQLIDNSVSSAGFTLTANQSGATYQWIDCVNGNTPIPGATNRSFSAMMNSDYAVVITLNGCTRRSSCISVRGVHASKIEAKADFAIYPNPTTGQFTLELGTLATPTTVRVFDVLGQTLVTRTVTTTKTTVRLDGYSDGAYFVEVRNGTAVAVKKILLKR